MSLSISKIWSSFSVKEETGIVHILLGNSIPPHGKLDQVIKYAFCLTNGLFRTNQLDLAVPGDHGHMKVRSISLNNASNCPQTFLSCSAGMSIMVSITLIRLFNLLEF